MAGSGSAPPSARFADVDPAGLTERASALAADGKAAMLVAVDGRAEGLVAVTDPAKDDSVAALAELRSLGLDVVMITGGARRTAEAVAAAPDEAGTYQLAG